MAYQFISKVHTDLALEAAEPFKNEQNFPEGVHVEENYDEKNEICVTVVEVTSDIGAEKLGKPAGKYITVETPHMDEPDESYHKEITEVLIRQLQKLVPGIAEKKILVAGIGNREITPDALGPLVVEHLFITRHLFQMYSKQSSILKGLGNISAIAPGVMGQTGMEGREIIHGIIKETMPDILIVIDALASRSIKRLNRTIQLTDTGIYPGAGIGNHRNELTQKSLGIPVIAIGIPTVIDAATIVTDTMQNMLKTVQKEMGLYINSENVTNSQKDKNSGKDKNLEKSDQTALLSNLYQVIASFDMHEQHALMREVMQPEMMDMFVTPKDIDETIGRTSYMISEAINSLCHQV